MEAYSLDLRRRVVAARDRGTPVVEIAATFSIDKTTVSRWLKRRDRTGTIRPLNQHTGRKRKLTDQDHRRLAHLVDEDGDITLQELKDHLGTDCCLATLWWALHRLGLTHKKDTQRRRARSPGCKSPAGYLAGSTQSDRPRPVRVPRRIRGQNEHDASARLVTPRPTAPRCHPPKPLGHDDHVVCDPVRRGHRTGVMGLSRPH